MIKEYVLECWDGEGVDHSREVPPHCIMIFAVTPSKPSYLPSFGRTTKILQAKYAQRQS